VEKVAQAATGVQCFLGPRYKALTAQPETAGAQGNGAQREAGLTEAAMQGDASTK
jgi:hypothetical protein